jgi:A/G-specific adenine glycosylase
VTQPERPIPPAAETDTREPEHEAIERRERAQRALLGWYAASGRAHLPWRHTRDPFAVLVAEVMLQQTQVERVLPKYEEFLARFPTLAALAAAPLAEVIRVWAGLGYNMRAVRLHEIARQAVERYGGALPGTLDELLSLKGIGRYTAGAVACFAFGLPVATVDTNIRRVLWRVFRGIEPAEWPADQTTSRMALALAEWALPQDHAYDWQQALMDLGATICQSRRPFCERCPLVDCCVAYQETARFTLFPSGEALARLRDARGSSGEETGGPSRRVAEARAGYAAAQANGGTKRRKKAAQPFTETSRYFRGRVVDTLRALRPGETLDLAALGARIKQDFTPAELPWLRALVAGLARDGLVRLAHESGEERVALP